MINFTPLALPTELWLKTFNQLDIDTRYKFSEVSKDFQKIGNDPTHWNRFLKPECQTDNKDQAKIIFRTNLTARNSEGLTLDAAGLLYSKIELLKQYDQEQYQQEIQEELDSLIDMGQIKPEFQVEKNILDYKEINSFFGGEHLSRIGKSSKEAALTIFNRPHLLEKINGDHLSEIAIFYKADKEIIINILTRTELYTKLDINHVVEIGHVYGKEKKLEAVDTATTLSEVDACLEILRRNLIPPVIADDYKYMTKIA